jgi:hypothetical protein
MLPECVVLPASAISQELALGSRGDQLDVEEPNPDAPVERLCKVVLPRRYGLDVGRTVGAGLAPVPSGLLNELRAVIAADDRRGRVHAGELLPLGHHVPALPASSYPNGQTEAAVPVDRVQELESAAI